MDFTNSITWGEGRWAFNSVWGKIRAKMTERFNLNTINKHIKMLKNLFTKMSKFFNWETTRLIQFHDCLFIDPRISWWSDSYMYQSLTGLQFRKTSFISIPILSRRIAARCSDTLFEHSSNVFPSCTIQNNCGNFFNLDTRFAKAGRRLGPVYMEVGVPMLVRWLA